MDAPLDVPARSRACSDASTSSVELSDFRVDRDELHTLLCSLSRELCRPLASLRSGFELLISDDREAVSPHQTSHVRTMMGLCDELLLLTRGYLDYAELARGARTPKLGPFSIGSLVRELDRRFGALARSRGQYWRAVAPDPDATIVTDASRCQEVLGNLVSNAIKYTPPGGTVAVTARVAGDSWRLTVDDDGPGVPADARDRIFEPFYRLPRDEHSQVEGTGLGLSICRELAAQLHGRILVDSEEGRGTSMTVVFPNHPPAADPH